MDGHADSSFLLFTTVNAVFLCLDPWMIDVKSHSKSESMPGKQCRWLDWHMQSYIDRPGAAAAALTVLLSALP